jgi:hypothetical protein
MSKLNTNVVLFLSFQLGLGLNIRHDGSTWILTHLKSGPNGFINRGPRPNIIIKFGGLHGAKLALKQNTTNFKCFPI